MDDGLGLMNDGLDLETRCALPKDLKVLLADYPRRVWGEHPNFGPMTQFYLDRHAMFREAMTKLKQETACCLGGATPSDEFGRRFLRLGGFFLQQLSGHHAIEDQHYFPALMKLEGRLGRAFDMLDRDHCCIHAALDEFADGANSLLRALMREGETEELRATVCRLERLDRLLCRHLDDEEEIVIPIMLDRGEAALEM